MIIPLREALIAAASASNKYIAETELNAHRSALEAGPATAFASLGDGATTARLMMGFPTSYAVTEPSYVLKRTVIFCFVLAIYITGHGQHQPFLHH